MDADPFVAFTGLTSSLNPSIYADTVTFTAVVSTSGGAPVGKVIFYEFVVEGFSTTQILGYRRTADRTTSGNLSLTETMFPFKTQNLFDLSHG